MPADLFFDEGSDHTLSALEVDPTQAKLLEWINNALTELESDPGHHRVRRRRYRTIVPDAVVWGIPVRSDDEDWLILWGEHVDQLGAVVVYYIGPDL